MASVEKELERPDYPSCFFLRDLPEKNKIDIVSPDDTAIDDADYMALTDFSWRGGVIDPEILREQLQNRGNKPSHPLVERFRGQVHNLQTFLQRRCFSSTAT